MKKWQKTQIHQLTLKKFMFRSKLKLVLSGTKDTAILFQLTHKSFSKQVYPIYY